jgi:hypothetical protein
VSNRGGAVDQNAVVRVEMGADFFCEILGIYGNERSSQAIEKDI